MKLKKLTDKQIGALARMFAIFALAYFLSGVAMAKTIRVAVIDTGFDFSSTWSHSQLDKPKLCAEGHRSFTHDASLHDNHGHGTHIAGLIAQGNKDIDYCLIIIKYFDPKSVNEDNLQNSLKAYVWAISQHADIINYSGGGMERSYLECEYMNLAMKNGAIVVAAAGNEASDLSKRPYYPAMCDDRIIKVVNVNSKQVRHPSSNYTSVPIANVVNELGVNVLSLLPNNSTGSMTGTSQATAIVTSGLVRSLQYIRVYDEQLHKLMGRIA